MLKYSFSVFFIAAFFLSSLVLAQVADSEKLFSEGRLLIENNCADCYGGTKEGFEEGVAKIIKAIDMGYEDKIAAYNVLAESYRILALVYAVPGSEEQEGFYEKFRETYQKILSLDPNETEMRFHYASSYRDQEKRIVEYKEILKIDPNNFSAHYAIGVSLIDNYVTGINLNDPRDLRFLEEGIEEVSKAIDVAKFDDVKLVEEWAILTLRSAGLVAQAEFISQKVQNRIDELGR